MESKFPYSSRRKPNSTNNKNWVGKEFDFQFTFAKQTKEITAETEHLSSLTLISCNQIWHKSKGHSP